MRTIALLVPLLLLGAAQERARPNIVFILVDDLRWNAPACMGHPFSKTPNIDRLAKEGALFRNAFVTTPLCSPSRASFLTGRYVRANGIKGNGNNNAASHELVTWPKLLKDAGYATAYMGKWHMGNDDSPRPGIDRWVSFKGQGAHVDPAINVDGKEEKVKGYMSDLLTDHAAEFVRRDHGKPFALYLAHKAVHGPFLPAERHKGLYADSAVERTPGCNDKMEGKPALTRKIENQKPPGPGTGPGDELVRNQLRMMAAIDEGLGKILAALEETKKLDSTMVVFTSDNGYFWGEHGLGDKRAAYEEAIRIPFLVRYPPLAKAGSVVEGAVLNVDVAPTFLDLAGAKVPDNIHGRSILPLLRGEAASWRASFVAEYFEEKQFGRVPSWVCLRSDRWKYIRYPGLQGMDELYDLKADPAELRNLIADPAAQEMLAALKEELARLEKGLQ